MQVEIDLFSGRPNPRWRLKNQESAEFLKLFRALPPTEMGTIQDNLGYRGLIVTAFRGTITGFKSVQCSGGIVVGHGPSGERNFGS
jgi:hypothetical protein